MFGSIGDAAVAFGRLHSFHCKENDVIVDETPKPVEPEPPARIPLLSATKAFEEVRRMAASGGQVIDGSWVLVVPASNKAAKLEELFGESFELDKADDRTKCTVSGELLGVFEGVPVIARWDVPNDMPVLCQQKLLEGRPDRMPN